MKCSKCHLELSYVPCPNCHRQMSCGAGTCNCGKCGKGISEGEIRCESCLQVSSDSAA